MKEIIYLGPDYGFNVVIDVYKEHNDVILKHLDKNNFIKFGLESFAVIDASMEIIFDDYIIGRMKNLKFISCATTGSSHIKFDKLKHSGIEIRTLRENIDFLRELTPAAELTWALLLACARNLIQASLHVTNGGWDRSLFPAKMINGKTLGIVGYGRIGKWMAKYAKAFGMKVIAHDPFLFDSDIDMVTLHELFKKSDFVTIHVHLTDETKGMINSDVLSNAKKGLVLINTSRGELLIEDDVVDAIKAGILDSVGCDVLCFEPQIAGSSLYKFSLQNSNVIITPHCGGYSPEAVLKVISLASEKIKLKL